MNLFWTSFFYFCFFKIFSNRKMLIAIFLDNYLANGKNIVLNRLRAWIFTLFLYLKNAKYFTGRKYYWKTVEPFQSLKWKIRHSWYEIKAPVYVNIFCIWNIRNIVDERVNLARKINVSIIPNFEFNRALRFLEIRFLHNDSLVLPSFKTWTWYL